LREPVLRVLRQRQSVDERQQQLGAERGVGGPPVRRPLVEEPRVTASELGDELLVPATIWRSLKTATGRSRS